MKQYRVMATQAVKIALDGGYCMEDKRICAINLTPTRMVFTVTAGKQLQAEDRDGRTIHVQIPICEQVCVGVDLPRNCFIRV